MAFRSGFREESLKPSFPFRVRMPFRQDSRAAGPLADLMRRLFRAFPLGLVVLGVVLLFERPAYAYADPGAGLLAVQAAGSALVAAGWYLRKKIMALFRSGSANLQQGKQSGPEDGQGSSNS